MEETNNENKEEINKENKEEINKENQIETNKDNKEESNKESQIETNKDNKEESNIENQIETNKENNEESNKENEEKDYLYISKSELIQGIANHLQYIIKGKGISDTIKRRYNDFYQLREKLILNWPGIYIPNIPSKKKVSELDTKKILFRVRALNTFLYNISKIIYLYESDEFKCFQNTNEDFNKAIEKIPKLNEVQILEKYKKCFNDYNENFDFVKGKENINSFILFLNKIKNNLNSMKNNIDVIYEKRNENIKNYLSLNKFFIVYDKNCILKYIDDNNEEKLIFNKNEKIKNGFEKLNELLKNPYHKVYIWIYDEKKDVDAMIEAINIINNLELNYNKLKQKNDIIDNDIKKIENGQSGFSFKGLFKKKDEMLNDLKQEKSKNDINLNNLNEIIKITSFVMNKNITEFKKEKIKNYFEIVKIFAKKQIENNNKLNELFNEIKNILIEIKEKHKEIKI